ncbi:MULTISPECIES: hypothetical protein [Acidobacterium]|uniref:hypothetical protein n=1 Tax=Acidobacterium TaxID=33973 RepID=UPI0002E86F4D|nr:MULTISPECIES: hypothetical protein [Acidobacterium]HCT62080.1 hypothetical protein [Acidobacterium sp.]
MMRTETFLECDQCKIWTASVDGAIFSHRDLRQAAKNLGWLRTRGSSGMQVDLCPICKPKKKGRVQ